MKPMFIEGTAMLKKFEKEMVKLNREACAALRPFGDWKRLGVCT